MPTTRTVHLAKPTEWDEFEKICLAACELRWGTSRLTRHGRRGQAQQGVDIYGDDNLGQFVGVQCKNTVGGISEAVVDQEIMNAESFSPTLHALYIATTADADAPLQGYVRRISLARRSRGQFTVDVLFWGDISHDLARDTNVLKAFYPQFFILAPQPSEAVGPSTGDVHRERDIGELTRLLNVVDLLSVERYLVYAPKYVAMAFLEHTEEIAQVAGSPLFRINSGSLNTALQKWLESWEHLASLLRTAPYDAAHNMQSIRFPMPMDTLRQQDEPIYSQLENAVSEFRTAHSDFCRYIRTEYPEIDVIATSTAARARYTPPPSFS